jgi:hypothetical protein
MGFYATVGVLWVVLALLFSWELAALTEPGVVLLCTLTHYVRRGQPWARVVTWVFFGLSAATNAVSLADALFTPSFIGALVPLVGLVLSCSVCLLLASVDSNEFFAAKGLITRSYDPAPAVRNPIVPQQQSMYAAPQPAAPGWYPVPDLPNDQLYWDGMGWTSRRRWTAAGYVEVDNAHPAPHTAGQRTATTTVAVAPNARSDYRTAVLLVALALIPPVIAIITLKTTHHIYYGPLHLP